MDIIFAKKQGLGLKKNQTSPLTVWDTLAFGFFSPVFVVIFDSCHLVEGTLTLHPIKSSQGSF